MTAPLYFKTESKTGKKETLPILTNSLLDAIDGNDLEASKKYIETILDWTISLDYFFMLYRYAFAHQHMAICKHIREIVIVISNTDIQNDLHQEIS